MKRIVYLFVSFVTFILLATVGLSFCAYPSLEGTVTDCTTGYGIYGSRVQLCTDRNVGCYYGSGVCISGSGWKACQSSSFIRCYDGVICYEMKAGSGGNYFSNIGGLLWRSGALPVFTVSKNGYDNVSWTGSSTCSLSFPCSFYNSACYKTLDFCLDVKPPPRAVLEICTTDCATGNPLPPYKIVNTLTGEVNIIDSFSTFQSFIPCLQSGDCIPVPGYALIVDGSNVLFGDSNGCMEKEVVAGTNTHSIFAIYTGYDLFIERPQINIPEGDTFTKNICLNKLYVDCGLRIYNGSDVVVPACEPTGTVSSSLRIYNGSDTYGVILVDSSDSMASGIRINTSQGVKAIRKLS